MIFLVSERFQIWCTSLLQHNGRATHEIVNVVARLVQVFFEQWLIHKTSAVLPIGRPLIGENVVHLEAIGELGGPLVERGAHE